MGGCSPPKAGNVASSIGPPYCCLSCPKFFLLASLTSSCPVFRNNHYSVLSTLRRKNSSSLRHSDTMYLLGTKVSQRQIGYISVWLCDYYIESRRCIVISQYGNLLNDSQIRWTSVDFWSEFIIWFLVSPVIFPGVFIRTCWHVSTRKSQDNSFPLWNRKSFSFQNNFKFYCSNTSFLYESCPWVCAAYCSYLKTLFSNST